DRLRPGGRARLPPRRRAQRAHRRLPRGPADRPRPHGGGRMRPPRTARGTVLDVALIWAMTAAAAAAFWPVYRDLSFVVMAVGAVLAATLVALLGARFRWPSFVVLLVGFAVL